MPASPKPLISIEVNCITLHSFGNCSTAGWLAYVNIWHLPEDQWVVIMGTEALLALSIQESFNEIERLAVNQYFPIQSEVNSCCCWITVFFCSPGFCPGNKEGNANYQSIIQPNSQQDISQSTTVEIWCFLILTNMYKLVRKDEFVRKTNNTLLQIMLKFSDTPMKIALSAMRYQLPPSNFG